MRIKRQTLILIVAIVAVISLATIVQPQLRDRAIVAHATEVVVCGTNPFGMNDSYRLDGDIVPQFLSILFANTTRSRGQTESIGGWIVVYVSDSESRRIACIRIHPELASTGRVQCLLLSIAYTGHRIDDISVTANDYRFDTNTRGPLQERVFRE